MTIRTASIREIKKLPKSSYRVIVMRYFPFFIRGIKGYINAWLPSLAPSEELLAAYRIELSKFRKAYPDNPKKGTEIAWNIVKFDLRFRKEILRNSKSMADLRRIIKKSKELKGKRVVYLLCHEVTDDFCHRRILKELMEKYNL